MICKKDANPQPLELTSFKHEGKVSLFSEVCRPGKWNTMQRGIQYLKELAVWEMVYYDPHKIQLRSASSWYTNSLTVMDWKGEEALTVDEVAG